jgi:hypothetical protein
MARKHAGHGYHKTEIVHHDDGSHTVTHHVHPDHAHEMKDKSYAAADHDGMLDGVIDNTGSPNEGEAEAEAGQHGVPPAQAAPAGLPGAPAPAPAQGA